jgi:hypothetical protein
MHFVTIRNCDAWEAGGAEMRSAAADSCEVHLCLFAGDRGDYFGALYRSAKGPMRITATNASRARADQCVGCMETNGGTGVIRYVVVDLASASSHNGGMCLRHMDSVFVGNCLFARCKHSSDESEAAAALLVYENPWDSGLIGCRFVGNHPDKSYTVTVASGYELAIRRCCFTGNAEKELNSKLVTTENCQFAQKMKLVMSWPDGQKPGFDEFVPYVSRTPNRGAIRLRHHWTFALVVCVAAAIAAALTWLRSFVLKRLKTVLRRRRALRLEHDRI